MLPEQQRSLISNDGTRIRLSNVRMVNSKKRSRKNPCLPPECLPLLLATAPQGVPTNHVFALRFLSGNGVTKADTSLSTIIQTALAVVMLVDLEPTCKLRSLFAGLCESTLMV